MKSHRRAVSHRETLVCASWAAALSSVAAAAVLTSVAACGGTDTVAVDGTAVEAPSAAGGASDTPPGEGSGAGGGAAVDAGHLVVVTERESPEASLQYLHLLRDWPANAEVDYGGAIELGEFVNVHAMGDAVFVHQPDDATVRRLVVNADGAVSDDQTISFAAYGVMGSSGDMVYVSPELAYFVDEAAAQIVTWNPGTLEVLGSVAIADDVLFRGGLPAQLSRGPALGGQGFVAASWRDWDTLEYHDAAALGVFDANALQPELSIVEDGRCASTVTTPFDGGDGFVYLVSDAALGFDALANPTRTQKALCVLRLRPGSAEFDPGFFVDLRAALGSPGFYSAHPMEGGKLLVNTWAPDVSLDGVATPNDPSWYWDYPPYFEYAIVDLATGTSVPVAGIPRAAVQWSLTLRVKGGTYVQTYRDDTGSDLHRVEPDGSVVRVLVNRQGTDVQYLGYVGG